MAELPENSNIPTGRQHVNQQQQQQLQPTAGVLTGPRTVVLQRHNDGFGFTLRHFIVYPPDSCTDSSVTSRLPAADLLNFTQPMDTVFVKKVHANSPAFYAGLQEGDRLLAVNGLPVAGVQYAQVVATIQQTPKTLTLQVVPKAYDILQTYFSDTAHNPETNQRPQPQQPIYSARQHPTQQRPLKMTRELNQMQEKQESLYSTLQEIAGTVQPQPPPQPQPPMMSKTQHQRQQFFLGPSRVPRDNESVSSVGSFDSSKTATTLSNSEIMMMSGGDSAIMSRLRKSFEQKEEFLRRPNNAFAYNLPMQPTMPNAAMQAAHEVQQREFYSRPNKLQKPVWPPVSPIPMITEERVQTQMPNSAPPIPTAHQSHLSAIREQFFSSGNKLQMDAKAQQHQMPLSPPALHVVQEKTKLFESGRPLSPDGIDRTELYKSELSRLSNKKVVPNVAVRRKEFELKVENAVWRRSTDEKPRSAASSMG